MWYIKNQYCGTDHIIMAEGSSEMESTKVQGTTSQKPHYYESPKSHHIQQQ